MQRLWSARADVRHTGGITSGGRFQFVPLWGLVVLLVYAPRRVDCRRCGVRVEWLPWCEPGGKSPTTLAFRLFLATWARRLSWKQTAQVFGVGWQTVYQSVAWVVGYGLDHRDLSGIEAIGVDEVAYAKGHRYATLVYQIDSGCRRLLHVAEGRSAKSFLSFFVMLKRHARRRGMPGRALIDPIAYVCSDLLAAYRKVIAKMLPGAYSGGCIFWIVITSWRTCTRRWTRCVRARPGR